MNKLTEKRGPMERTVAILLALYPKAFRNEYGRPIAQLIRDQRRDLGDAGAKDRVRFWLSVVVDVARSARAERVSALSARLEPAQEHRRAWLVRSQVLLGLLLLASSGGNLLFDLLSEKLSMGVGALLLTVVAGGSGTSLIVRARRAGHSR